MARMSRSDQLAQFLQGGFKQGADAFKDGYGRASAQKRADALRQQNPGARVTVGADGGESVDPRDPLSNLLRGQQINSLQEERDDRAVERYADKVDKSGVTKVAPVLEQTEKSFQGKSVGPIMNMLPTSLQGVAANVKSRIGEAMNKPEWMGAGEEFQDLTSLINIDTRAFAGAAQTQFEQAKQEVEKGLQAGGSPDQVRAGISKMRAVLAEQARNAQAGARPEAVQTYEGRGGMSLSNLIKGQPAALPRQTAGQPPTAPGSGMDPARKKRLEELRAKRDRGEI